MERMMSGFRKSLVVCMVVVIATVPFIVSSAQEITVTIYGTFGSASEAFTNEFPQLVQSIYPEISVEIEIPRLIPITAPDREWPQMIESGEYDIFVLTRLGLYDPEVNFLPLDRYLASMESQNPTFNTHVEASKVSGVTYVLPQVISPTVVLYSKHIFEESMVDVPGLSWTWTDFRDTIEKLAPASEIGAFIDLRTLETFLLQQGISVTDVTRSELESALHFFLEMAEAGWVKPGFSEAGLFFQDGTVAMAIGSAGTLASLSSESSFNHGFIGIPQYRGATPTTPTLPSTVAGISVHTQHPDAAWKVLELLSMAEGARYKAQNGLLPTYVTELVIEEWSSSLMPSALTGSDIREVLGLPMVMLDWGNSRNTDDLGIVLALMFSEVLNGNQTVQSAVEEFMQLRATQGH